MQGDSELFTRWLRLHLKSAALGRVGGLEIGRPRPLASQLSVRC
jgi:hypothetical protein